ncbi:MAG TPA: acetyl-CoA carboxylase biotin carboxyl carrier protein subunit [Clostridiales bacterium]|nr:acetyl-CoA carboxylase biotin carboxyl carrier protein subunit [Clostridiales bacterium]
MKKFNVTVNGKTYAVEVEEVGAGNGGFTYQPVQQAPQALKPDQAPKTASAPQPQAAPAPKAQSEPVSGETISAPMPGTILDVRVSEGQSVKAGDILFILEAMKMENEIVSPKDGVVNKIHTSKSSNVNTGDALITIG